AISADMIASQSCYRSSTNCRAILPPAPKSIVHTLLEKFAPKGAEIVTEAEANAKKRRRQATSRVTSLSMGSSRFLLRQRTSDCGGVKGLGAGAGAGRGGDAGFCVPSLAIVPTICC